MVLAETAITIFICVCMTYMMATSSKELLASNTRTAIDGLLSGFLGVSWFFGVEHLANLVDDDPHHSLLFRIGFTLVLYVFAIYASYSLRHHAHATLIFNNVFTNVVMMAKAGAVHSAHVTGHQDGLHPLFMFVIVNVCMFALMFVAHKCIKPAPGSWDDAENDTVSGSLAAAFVVLVHLAIVGDTPDTVLGSKTEITKMQGMELDIFAWSSLAISGWLSVQVDKHMPTAYWPKRFCVILQGIITSVPTFALIQTLYNHVSHDLGFAPGTMIAMVVLVDVCSLLCLICILICAFLPCLNNDTDMAQTYSSLFCGVGSFLFAVAWSNLIDTSMADTVSNETSKALLNFGIVAVITPAYYWILHPLLFPEDSEDGSSVEEDSSDSAKMLSE